MADDRTSVKQCLQELHIFAWSDELPMEIVEDFQKGYYSELSRRLIGIFARDDARLAFFRRRLRLSRRSSGPRPHFGLARNGDYLVS